MTRVLVTRPEPGATRTADRLIKLGYEAIKLPLSETVALHPKAPTSTFDIVIATSAQAFLNLPSEMVALLKDESTLVVGEATKAAALQVGFTDVLAERGDIEGLLERLNISTTATSKLLYLCGKVRRPDLELTLGARGIAIEPIEVYDTKLVSHSTDKLKALCASDIDAVLVTSVMSADALRQIQALDIAQQAFEKTLFICFSERIASQLLDVNRANIIVSPTPDEDAVIALLARHCPA
ncbi:MAG: uroporphyrinogen-III synthase [Rhizobiaceae bacterium]